tara:strand:- start:2315 stop:3298 length:984 start_codon:yes stop_codon:yes gene_type:complete
MNDVKKILITGESGFIGSHLIKHFVFKYPHYLIHGLDSLTYASNKNLTKDLIAQPNYFFHEIDIRNRHEVLDFFIHHQISDVIHLAAESHVDNSIANPLIFAETNILGTINLLDAFKEVSSGRFHHVSTDEVYGDLDINDRPFDENFAYAPNSPYSASKASSDHFVRAYYKTYGLDSVITNCSNNYGPHQHEEKFIPTIIMSILNNQSIPIYGKGTNIRDWLYVKDHVEALDIVFHNGSKGEAYNIGANNEISNLDLVHHICNICVAKNYHSNPKKLISFVADRLGHDKRYAINFSKIQEQLSWKPKFDFQTALGSTIDWYVTNFQS